MRVRFRFVFSIRDIVALSLRVKVRLSVSTSFNVRHI